MEYGKNICRQLQAIRDEIAQENDITLERQPCTHKGDCLGTCPYCEGELRYLETELGRRISMGKAVTVAGLAMALAVTGSTAAQTEVSSHPLQGKIVAPQQRTEQQRITLTGRIVDNRSGRPVAEAHVALTEDGELVAATLTDSTGSYLLSVLKAGRYMMTVNAQGYESYKAPVDLQNDTQLPTILMANGAPVQKSAYMLGGVGSEGTFVCDTARSSVPLVKEKRCSLKIKVIEEKTEEPIPLFIVRVMIGDSVVASGRTDFDGIASLEPPYGTYDIVLTHVLYESIVIHDIKVDRKKMELERVVTRHERVIVGMPAVIIQEGDARVGTDAPTQVMEREGVRLIVR